MSGDEAAQPVPPGSGRARDLARGVRRARRAAPDTGRRHHIGDAPAVLPVLRPDGTVGTTRTSPVQLRDRSEDQLATLTATLDAEMRRAAAELEFEEAAHLREELAAVRRELAARRG